MPVDEPPPATPLSADPADRTDRRLCVPISRWVCQTLACIQLSYSTSRNVSAYSDAQRFCQGECAQVDDADCVALSIGDVGVLAKRRAVVRHCLLAEIPPPKAAKDGDEYRDEKKLSQSGVGLASAASEEEKIADSAAAEFRRRIGFIAVLRRRKKSYLLTMAGSLTSMAGTVLPTTGAIWRTCFMSSSN